MSSPMQSYPPPAPVDSGSNLKTAVLVGAVVAMLAANVYLYMQVDVLKTEISKLRESIATEVTSLRSTSRVSRWSLTIATRMGFPPERRGQRSEVRGQRSEVRQDDIHFAASDF